MAAASGKTFDCVSPIDGKLLTKVAACDAEDVNRAVAAARAVFEKGSWSACHPAKRKKVMLKFAELMQKHKDELALLETLDMGKPISVSAGVPAIEALTLMERHTKKAITVLPVIDGENVVGMVRMHDLVQAGLS